MDRLIPLGDQGVLVYFADESAAWHFASAVRHAAAPWCVDVVQAYTSVAVFYDPSQVRFSEAATWLAALDREPLPPDSLLESHTHRIPCCYELGADLTRVAEHVGLSTEELIRLHAGTEYTVYAIGFCPGFPYLGYLPPALSGVPRLETPRLRVEAGSVGLTGRQTGIYTEVRPGGWNLIGRTPLQLVSVPENYFPLRTGDRVRFEPIDQDTFRKLLGERL